MDDDWNPQQKCLIIANSRDWIEIVILGDGEAALESAANFACEMATAVEQTADPYRRHGVMHDDARLLDFEHCQYSGADDDDHMLEIYYFARSRPGAGNPPPKKNTISR